ncbi:MAG: hypothetical protein ABI910_20580, partial [Gemmatimonadota bacterium]
DRDDLARCGERRAASAPADSDVAAGATSWNRTLVIVQSNCGGELYRDALSGTRDAKGTPFDAVPVSRDDIATVDVVQSPSSNKSGGRATVRVVLKAGGTLRASR